MKKGILLFVGVLLCLGLVACADPYDTPLASESTAQQEPPTIQNSAEASESRSTSSQAMGPSSSNATAPETGEKKLKLTINGQEFDVTLYDTPAANALYDMLPLELNFEDFNGIEKIAYIDSELPIEGEPDAFDPDVSDLCLYAPWGNLSIFYKDFRSSNGLISLGHIDSGIEAIGGMNENFSATLAKVED